MSEVQTSALNLSTTVQYLDPTISKEDSESDNKQNGSVSIQCILCLKKVSVSSSRAAAEKSFQCDLCKKQTKKTDGIITQIKVYSDDKIDRNLKDESSSKTTFCMQQCWVCYRLFNNEQDLETHISVQELDHSSKCGICAKEYDRLCHLNTHRKTIYTGLRPHLCVICEKQFFCGQDLSKHKKNNHPAEMLYSCKECPRRFAALHHLKLHAKIHQNNAKYTCDLCTRTFHYKGYLSLHMRTHNEYRVKCDVCDESFLSTPLLNSHKIIHGLDLSVDNELPTTEHEINDLGIMKQVIEIKTNEYECDVCDFQSQSKQGLNSHVVRVHANKGSKCELCNIVISSSHNLFRHKRSVHKKYYKTQIHCGVCMKVFQSQKLLEEHMRMHIIQNPHSCKDCGKRYRTTKMLLNHMHSYHPRDVDMNSGNNDTLNKSPGLNSEEEEASCDHDDNSNIGADTIIEVDD